MVEWYKNHILNIHIIHVCMSLNLYIYLNINFSGGKSILLVAQTNNIENYRAKTSTLAAHVITVSLHNAAQTVLKYRSTDISCIADSLP